MQVPSNLQEYSYAPFQDNNSIRILILDPGQGDDPLVGELREVDVDDCPSFTALSYVWEDPTRSRQFTCDGKLLRITKSLDYALRGVRHATDSLRLWADQVCIYSYRTATKCCRNLRFRPQFCEGFGFASHCLDPIRRSLFGLWGPFGSRLQLPTAPPNTFQLSLLPGNFESFCLRDDASCLIMLQ